MARVNRQQNTNLARNVIMFLGDGMSIPTLAAARTHLGQRIGHSGEETQLSFEKFPFSGLAKTYCVNGQVADSACSATAFLCGIKANEATIGVTAAVKYKDCEAERNKSNHVESIAHFSQLSGKRTGIITTTTITHATPAGAYAHTSYRGWESDANVIADDKNPNRCPDIASQLVNGDTGRNFNVIFGGGRKNFLPKNVKDEDGKFGVRLDGRNLINEWKGGKRDAKHEYVYNLSGLKVIEDDTEFSLGLFASGHMSYNLDRNETQEPSLEEMTIKAIKLLSKSNKGFFLFVEGGRIDHAHHKTLPRKALDETIEFHKAIQAAVELTDELETLIVVTSDHAHTMSMNGYPSRGNDVLGIAGYGNDNLPYTSLSYANGPGKKTDENGNRVDITRHNLSDPSYAYPSYIPLNGETHGGDDVAVFASGPWAHLFSGVIEQNVIPHVIKFASCVGEDNSTCSSNVNSGASSFRASLSFLCLFLTSIHYVNWC
ncbi:hypothetical protein RI129_009717 [Pyrocoelia pectoralis]|uniref:Alkaline phosphatase n=1 Tax=Pyrocoelia pectoralis TaxID=417401 RepID=A0AAN7V2U5_9COLE